jgi:hypothetical protein
MLLILSLLTLLGAGPICAVRRVPVGRNLAGVGRLGRERWARCRRGHGGCSRRAAECWHWAGGAGGVGFRAGEVT